jgi:hypothetical protein
MTDDPKTPPTKKPVVFPPNFRNTTHENQDAIVGITGYRRPPAAKDKPKPDHETGGE